MKVRDAAVAQWGAGDAQTSTGLEFHALRERVRDPLCFDLLGLVHHQQREIEAHDGRRKGEVLYIAPVVLEGRIEGGGGWL